MIYDILSTQAGAGELNFVAALPPPNSVLVNPPGAATALANALLPGGNEWFEPGDNIRIDRLYVSIPFGFGQGIGQVRAQFEFRDGAGVPSTITEFANTGWITIPNMCEGIAFPGDGLFVRMPSGVGVGRHRLILVDLEAQVSMVNLPASLVGVDVQLQIHLGISHTRPMAPAP